VARFFLVVKIVFSPYILQRPFSAVAGFPAATGSNLP
jgi:hypothetical protein